MKPGHTNSINQAEKRRKTFSQERIESLKYIFLESHKSCYE
jgi:hypothetical protein